MSANYFVLYGNKVVTPHITGTTEILSWAARNSTQFKADNFASVREAIEAADRILLASYQVWGLFEYTPEGMAEFIAAAALHGDLTELYALEVATEYMQEAQKYLSQAHAKALKKAIDHVPFPERSEMHEFTKYVNRITAIRDLSIAGLAEYVKNGHEFLD
jgi:hypothetical protein